MKRTIVHILCLLLIGFFCVQCNDESEEKSKYRGMRNIEHIGVFWAQTGDDILVKVVGFKLDDGAMYATEYGVDFRVSDGSLIIQSDEQERTVQLVNVGQIEILDMSLLQWDQDQVCIVLHIKHNVE